MFAAPKISTRVLAAIVYSLRTESVQINHIPTTLGEKKYHRCPRSVLASHHKCRDAHRRGGVVDGAGDAKM